ncbi:MAG: hypothetical protein WDA75_08600 [Candidatus Latescibacterota bacterium]
MAVLLSFVVAGVAWGQADPAQVAQQVLSDHLGDGSVTLSALVTEWGETFSLPPDSVQPQVQVLVRQIQQALAQPAIREVLKQRWAGAEETKGLDLKRGTAFLQELAKGTASALARPEDYTVATLVASAARKKSLPVWQGLDALRVAVTGVGDDSSTRVPIDTLYLEVLSRELLELVPGMVDSREQALSYHKYWHVLPPDYMSRSFLVFFLSPANAETVWGLAAEELITAGVCRVVARQPRGALPGHPLLILYATFFIPEAYGRLQFVSFEIGQYRGMPRPASQRRVTRYCLKLHQTLTLPGSQRPAWEDLGAVRLKVTEYGPHPDDPTGTGPRTYPVKVEYQETIIEQVFIEFLREKLCPTAQ